MLQGEIQGECGVCRKALTPESPGLVVCTKCRALYHPECWGFNGAKCGIYGCGAAPGKQIPPTPRAACRYHPGVTGTGACVVCSAPLCGACSWTSIQDHSIPARRYCDLCVPRSPGWSWVVVVAALLAMTIVIWAISSNR